MNPLQKLAVLLFKWDYVVEVWQSSVHVHRARKVGNYWLIGISQRIKPGGGVYGSGSTWEPLTPRVARFYRAETL